MSNFSLDLYGSGTYTVPAPSGGITYYIDSAYLFGGGGGGGTTAGGLNEFAGGGGGGAFAYHTFSGSGIGGDGFYHLEYGANNLSYSVGSGGLAGTANSNQIGHAGGDTLITCESASLRAGGGRGGSSFADYSDASGGLIYGDYGIGSNVGQSGYQPVDGLFGSAGDGGNAGGDNITSNDGHGGTITPNAPAGRYAGGGGAGQSSFPSTSAGDGGSGRLVISVVGIGSSGGGSSGTLSDLTCLMQGRGYIYALLRQPNPISLTVNIQGHLLFLAGSPPPEDTSCRASMCLKSMSVCMVGSGAIYSQISAVASTNANIVGSGQILTRLNGILNYSSLIIGSGDVKCRISASPAMFKACAIGLGTIYHRMTPHLRYAQTIIGHGIADTNINKLWGDFSDFGCSQKLFPIGDVSSDFLNEANNGTNLYQSIDEGVYTGDYTSNFGQSTELDDTDTYIQPASTLTNGTFTYKCIVTKPIIKPEESRLRIRAAGPASNSETFTAPRYTFYNIFLNDPSGNLIIQYNDLVFRGDEDPNNLLKNYTTYSITPIINNSLLNCWDDNYPLMNEPSGYTLSFDVLAESLSKPFDDGFNLGFNENDMSDPSGNTILTTFIPIDSLKISAIEICNSGGYGPSINDYLTLFAQVREKGRRIERKIFPNLVMPNGFDTGIYPTVSSVWVGNNSVITNTSLSGCKTLANLLVGPNYSDNITLSSTSIANSGKLTLRLGTAHDNPVTEVSDGAFGFGFDQSTYNNWTQPTGAFNTENRANFEAEDGFFVIESISLKFLAKKASGSPNYVLDVVGYSDDRILNITSAVGGFLQNIEGSGSYPVTSGFLNPDGLILGGEPLSDLDGYFTESGHNLGGDHYSLATLPVVTGTNFNWYEIPLKGYDDNVELGVSRDYHMSSLFEKIYLDLYPIPSGASLSNLHLLVRYAPQNAINLLVQGGEEYRIIDKERSEAQIYPSARNSGDYIINAGSGYAPLSMISGIPQAFDTPTTLKSNYSRRWKGLEGLVQGAFDPNQFDFSYNNPLLDCPFISGFYDFDYDLGTSIISRIGGVSGTLTTSYATPRIKNLGWRFTNSDLFTSQLPGYSGAYQTTDWTSLSSGITNFTSHPLYGKIADASNNFLRLGPTSTVNFGPLSMSGGFGVYLRFSPDVGSSGVGGGPFQSGCLISKWDSGKGLEFALGYASGYLRAYATDSGGVLRTVQDSVHYSVYQFPLSVILTYNDHGSGGLKLYTDNEFSGGWTYLRGSSIPFTMTSGNSNLSLGNSTGSGVGFHMFASEFGIAPSNIVYANANLLYKEETAQGFLQGNHVKWWNPGESYTNDTYKLWDYVNENPLTDWTIGDYQFNAFSPAFSQLTKRTGRDLISFNLLHDGSGYSQRVNQVMPSSVNNGAAYHTQIENDFLRFDLSDVPSNFYSIARRITKDLPRGYKFTEGALLVETVIDHVTSGEVRWSDGTYGPKLIVSLYTKKQEPYWTPDEPNWGLINRAIHYLPSSCIMKLNSKFDYDSLIDNSESWANFPLEPRQKEFEEKYYADDVNQMFLQYDLAYPSGSPFNSRINIYSAHVRSENAWVVATPNSGALDLVSSGGHPVNEQLNLLLEARQYASGNIFCLYTVGPNISSGNFNLYTSGAFIAPASMPLVIDSSYTLSSGINLYSEGEVFLTHDASGALNLTLFGLGIVTSSGNGHLGMSLTSFNDQTSNIPSGGLLSLFAMGDSGTRSIYANMPIFIANNISAGPGGNSGVINLTALGSSALLSRYPNAAMNLFIFSNNPSEKLNLTLYGDNYPSQTLNQSLNLFTGNYLSEGDGATYLRWFNENYGSDIEVADNVYASVAADNGIRGVTLIGYGACDSNSPQKAIDNALITHDTVWREETCNDGGIFRAIDTYTNSGEGYSGNFYGIRKYGDLLPNTAYNVELRITTGSTETINVPREWEEWEYGTNQTINYSGVKLVSDYDSTEVSGRLTGDMYGTKTVVKGDLLAVGSPFHIIPDESGFPINNAGTVYLYRRDEDIAGQKAGWSLLQDVTLPSGYKRDFIVRTIPNMLTFNNFSISGHQWNIGQEGREFGHSIDIAQSGQTEVMVVGAPGASWSRQFDNFSTSGIPVCMMVFTDQFTYDEEKVTRIGDAANKWNILYKYFSAPWFAGTSGEFQPQVNIKLLICQLVKSDEDKPLVKLNQNWMYHTYLDRLDDPYVSGVLHSGTYLFNSMLSGVNDLFYRAFPRTSGAISSGIPGIMSIFEDNSFSTSNGNATKAVVDAFVSSFKSYSYASGLTDPNTHLKASGYVNRISEFSSDWYLDSLIALNDTLDSGNLITNDALKFITSGVGQVWAKSNAYEFQIPPIFGGRVYVFENESGVFNLVQEIKSPDEQVYDVVFVSGSTGKYLSKPSDRFGHSVSISKNAEVIAVGSPYSSETVSIFEKDYNEDQRMYDGLAGWLAFTGKGVQQLRYISLVNLSGIDVADRTVYSELSPSDKFAFRTDVTYWSDIITPYKKVYTYSPSYRGTWQFIPDEYAGTTRLGYSSAISEDGDTVAFGAPTDSFNEFDDTNVWYKAEDTWASYTNAGAVRTFSARKYYPHDLVVEFYKFGNLDRDSHPESAQYYEQMGLYFSPDNIPFERTNFQDLEIPQNAGLAFIITPEIDAASDEIINNIKSWLSLGDRTLVLVGNDPIYEENGKYRTSNEIINKILLNLNSRMRIVPARTSYEALALSGCASVASGLFNVTQSFIPRYAHNTNILTPNMYAYGVGDIKVDLTQYGEQDLFMPSPCDDLNSKCQMPIKHLGDMRAEWNAQCTKTNPDGSIVLIDYKQNIPFNFGNSNPAEVCDDYPTSPHPIINRPLQDPRPLLTTAEWLPAITTVIPAQSGVDVVCTPIIETIISTETDILTYYNFEDSQIDNLEFLVEDNGGPSGTFYSYSQGGFFNPDAFDGRDGLLQATGVSYFLDPVLQTRNVSNTSVMATQENYLNTSSVVILMASVFAENSQSVYSNNNNDHNIPFFGNLVLTSGVSYGHATVKQVGGFTGAESFSDAYSNSVVKDVLIQQGNTVVENFTLDDDIYSGATLWIANPQGVPSADELNKLKNWLNVGNKKVIVTYNGTQESAKNVAYLCSGLSLTNAPYYSVAENQYLTQNFDYVDTANDNTYNGTPDVTQQLDYSNPIIHGYTLSDGTSTAIYKVVIQDEGGSWIPINAPTGLIYYNQTLTENYYTVPFAWKFTAQSEVKFDVQQGSGYRVFFNWVSETVNETFYINAKVSNVNRSADQTDQTSYTASLYLTGTPANNPQLDYMDIRVPSGISRITVGFDTTQFFKIDPSGIGVPITPRILSVSGCLLPIDIVVVDKEITTVKEIVIGQTCENVPWFVDEQTIITPPVFTPMRTESAKYCYGECDYENQLIQDGPVVAAEEFENFSPFLNGSQRSRIVVLSDSTMIQGLCQDYRGDALTGNQEFIRSLYPPQPNIPLVSGEKRNDNVRGTNARQFTFTQKLLSPERGSPAKYYAASGLAGLVSRFGLGGVAGHLDRYTDGENVDPADVARITDPKTVDEINAEIQNFANNIIPVYGVFPRISGSINGSGFVDAGLGGGLPDILVRTGKDYLEFENSGYYGDLFGYSVGIHNDKLLVGCPFNGFKTENITAWSGIQANVSGLNLDNNGGAGSVYYFENTGSGHNALSDLEPWEFKQKIKPSSIHLSDQFGYSLSLDADMASIGTPNHSYDSTHQHIYSGAAAFIRKEFNDEFDIPQHIITDQSASGAVSGNGAAYTYLHQVVDWKTLTKVWEPAEKVTAQGFNARVGADHFGKSVSITRARRGDGDYTMSVGAPIHKYPITSGSGATNAGATYVYDAMLRLQVPAIPSEETFITASVFGNKVNFLDTVNLSVTQNTTGDPITYVSSGLVFANDNGDIFLEGSGFDPASRGFISHRPFVESVIGQVADTTLVSDYLSLIASGEPVQLSGAMNLIMLGESSAVVYNSMDLYVDSWNPSSGIINLTTYGASGIGSSGFLNIVTSGMSTSTTQLDLRIRGK